MSEVYANILESLTSGLYNEVKYSVREYLQNAYDAIKEAKRKELPVSSDGYYARVEITRDNKTITIFDNGIGMDASLLKQYTSIGGGTKYSPEDTGYKGIGKLSGLRFFNEFRVRSKQQGSLQSYELCWKCGEMIQKVMNEREKIRQIPYRDFIRDYCTIREIEEHDKDAHYTQVQLIDIMSEFQPQLNEQDIGNFISQNCPVPFSSRFRYAQEIREWTKGDFEIFDTFINDKKVYQLYDDIYGLVEPVCVEIRYDDCIRAKAWFSWVRNSASIIAQREICGIKFRCKGICVGDANLFDNFCMPPGRGNFSQWFTGEVIILDDDIMPAADRKDFVESSNRQKFYEEIQRRVGKDLSFIADIRSKISSSESDHKKLTALMKARKRIPPQLVKSISERIKDLEKCKTKYKSGLDFGIIQVLQSDLQEVEKYETAEPMNSTAKAIPQTKPDILVKILELKEEQDNLSSQKAKDKRQEHIDELTEHLLRPLSEDTKLELIVNIIVKFLKAENISCDRAKVIGFVENELSRNH